MFRLSLVTLLLVPILLYGQKTSGPQIPSLNEQKVCSDQAQIYSRNLHGNLSNEEYIKGAYRVTSLYDTETRICYVKESWMNLDSGSKPCCKDATVLVTSFVNNAFTGRNYAKFLYFGWEFPHAEHSRSQSDLSELFPNECFVITLDKRIDCLSALSYLQAWKRYDTLTEKLLGI